LIATISTRSKGSSARILIGSRIVSASFLERLVVLQLSLLGFYSR